MEGCGTQVALVAVVPGKRGSRGGGGTWPHVYLESMVIFNPYPANVEKMVSS